MKKFLQEMLFVLICAFFFSGCSCQRIDLFSGCGVRKVCCGTQFTTILTKDGRVYTFGLDRLIGQPESRALNHNAPQQVHCHSHILMEFLFDVKCHHCICFYGIHSLTLNCR